jgi:hypothetical protein
MAKPIRNGQCCLGPLENYSDGRQHMSRTPDEEMRLGGVTSTLRLPPGEN